MAEQLVGRIVWQQKDEVAEPTPAKRDCRGLEGRIVHAQTVETAQAVLATAAAVRTTSAAAPLLTRSEQDTLTLEAVEVLGDLNPHWTQGPGRKLGL